MSVLLDTHVWIWWLTADRIIAATARCKGVPLATWDKALRRSRAMEIWRA